MFTLRARAADFISGGGGRDTLSYLPRTSGGGIKVDATDGGSFNDGQSGEDRVATDVEQVLGTNFDDVVFVPNQSQDVNRTTHGLLAGHNGNDQLLGSPFNDTINGGAGVDKLFGGSGDDLLEARENSMAGQTVARDELQCGPGNDVAVMDLQDVQTGCENLSIAAIDEGGILSIGRRAKLHRNRALVSLRCPADAKTACHGKLTLTRAGKTLGSKSYRLAKGAAKRVAVKAARGTVQATAVEPDSKGRPKTTIVRLKLR
jgi:hypothetical protein